MTSILRCDAPGCGQTGSPPVVLTIGAADRWIEVQVDEGYRTRTVHGCTPEHAVRAVRALLCVPAEEDP